MSLQSFRGNRTLMAWAALMVFTLVSFAFGDGLGPAKAASVAALVIAYVKVNVIGQSFMELHGAPKPLQIAFAAFTCITGSGLIGIYLIA